MIIGQTLEELLLQLESVKKKAEKIQPEVHEIEFRQYNVQGSRDNWYHVVFGKRSDGQLFSTCTCFGALHQGKCYHQAAAIAVHIQLCKERKAAKEKDEQSNSPYFQGKLYTEKPTEKVGKFRI